MIFIAVPMILQIYGIRLKHITEEIATVSHLQQNTTYHFKLQPKYNGGVGEESGISESKEVLN